MKIKLRFTKAIVRLPALLAKQTGGIHESVDEEFALLEVDFKTLDRISRYQ